MDETEQIVLNRVEDVEFDAGSQLDRVKSPKKGRHNLDLGLKGEAAAVRYLERRGYDILQRQFTCQAGEADIIARIEDCLCFIEVKTRTGTAKGFPEEAVDARKRGRYERIAAYYLKDHVSEELRVRFDVMSVIVLSESHAFLRFHKNAYGVDW